MTIWLIMTIQGDRKPNEIAERKYARERNSNEIV